MRSARVNEWNEHSNISMNYADFDLRNLRNGACSMVHLILIKISMGDVVKIVFNIADLVVPALEVTSVLETTWPKRPHAILQ